LFNSLECGGNRYLRPDFNSNLCKGNRKGISNLDCLKSNTERCFDFLER